MIFVDRYDAGRRLAALLEQHRVEHPLVLGIPRGGVVVAYEIAAALGAELDAHSPQAGSARCREYALGAIAPGTTIVNQPLIAQLGVSEQDLARVIGRELGETVPDGNGRIAEIVRLFTSGDGP